MRNIVLIFTLFISGFVVAQKDTLAKYNVNELINKSHLSKSKTYAEEVLRRNPSDSIKIQATMIISDYYIGAKNDYMNAILFCKKSMALAKKANYTESYLEALSTASVYYAMMNKKEEALALLKEQKKYSSIKNYELYTNDAEIYYYMGDFEKSISIDKKVIEKIKLSLQSNKLKQKERTALRQTLSNIYGNVAATYNYQKKLDSASYYIEKAQEAAPDPNNNYNWFNRAFNLILRKRYDDALSLMDRDYDKYIKDWKSSTYLCLYYKSVCYYKKGDFEKGLYYAKLALKNNTGKYNFEDIELECYTIAAACAEKLGRPQEASAYNKKYIEISKKVNYEEKAAFMAKLYEQNEIKPLKTELASKSRSAEMLFEGFGIICIVAIYLGYRNVKSKREKKKFLAIIERLESKNSTNTEQKPKEDSEVAANVIEKESLVKTNISPETENKILKSLDDFEKNKRFLESGLSLGTIASEFQTNTTYITYVISKHKNDNLINYINKLRIDYIIRKITHDPEYAKYKVEYLAQESGFSSYLTFKRVFHKETGMNPSTFIGYLSEA